MQVFEWLHKAAPRRSSGKKKLKPFKDAAFQALHFRKRGSRKAVPDYDQMSSDSPKCSSTTSSTYSSSRSFESSCNLASSDSFPGHDMDLSVSRKGTWITTDSDYVVLELWSGGNDYIN